MTVLAFLHDTSSKEVTQKGEICIRPYREEDWAAIETHSTGHMPGNERFAVSAWCLAYK